MKLEGSAFNGREPDETRYNFDFGPMDSFSGRITVAPTRNWALQYSYGHLVEPEALEPGNLNRQTASITYNRPFARGYWANSLIWGRNHKTLEDRVENSYLYETTFNFADKNYLYSRLELVDKDELDLAPPLNDQSFRIGSYSFGGVRDLVQNKYGQVGLGAGLTFYSKPASLDAVYGRNPVSFSVFEAEAGKDGALTMLTTKHKFKVCLGRCGLQYLSCHNVLLAVCKLLMSRV